MRQQNRTTKFTTSSDSLNAIREQIVGNKHAEEHVFVENLIASPALTDEDRVATTASARALVLACRKDTRNQTLLDSFLQEFGLSNKEGVALMCLAEALLRVPDKTTADRLIAEKMTSGDWKSHSGKSESTFVNAATWGMILTGNLVQLDNEITQQTGPWIKSLSSKLSEPVVRRAILQAMRIMGGQYVLGRTIDEGVKKGAKLNSDKTRYSFDMLGEAARTEEDAQRYFTSYSRAFDRIGKRNSETNVALADGVSVKLSALHPQYHFAHRNKVMEELLPRITALCLKAKQYNIGLSIDAEEAARLEMSLDIFEELCRNPDLHDWDGLGFVMQAYQKRAPVLANWLIELGRETGRKLMVRLVKGAYWDAEIKHAQEQGLSDYPVFTRKVNTDACYLHCAKLLLQAEHSVFPQFATHNAYTTIALLHLAQAQGNFDFEFQRLHGMGELLYKHLAQTNLGKDIPLRVYAPIGQHADLLPYLVRRLLENGANSSFVNRFLDNETPIAELIQDVYEEASQYSQLRHSEIPLPIDLLKSAGDNRLNSEGLDLDDAATIEQITQSFEKVASQVLCGHSIVSGKTLRGDALAITSPSTGKVIGESSHANSEMVERALRESEAYKASWQSTPNNDRAAILNSAADLLEDNMLELMAIINIEAGRTIPDCVSEVREAVDFCRYYALQATVGSAGQTDAHGRGTFFCISPWNFPLAIFVGQVAAALAAGNCVIAKPAEQTPLVASRAVELFHSAGCPAQALQLLLGPGPEIGNVVNSDPRIDGIVFTGSTLTAQRINHQVAQREGETIPLVAETGGQNCMIVDSTALPEQVVDDVISSAFHSAGQRCSALRVLYLQDVVADKIIDMLRGAMNLIKVNDPRFLSTDVGPVIDETALESLIDHQTYLDSINASTYTVDIDIAHASTGTFYAPRMVEIDNLAILKREVFGPVLHIIRYKADEVESVIDEINSTGYGLTLGIHSRIEAFANYVFSKTNVGNTYINRNTIGAVVGVNPFGGQGLSGTGPKAGGPNYLHRFQRQTERNSTDPIDINHSLASSSIHDQTQSLDPANSKHKRWSTLTASERCARLRKSVEESEFENPATLLSVIDTIIHQNLDIKCLPGPTGEENLLHYKERGTILVFISENDSSEQITHLLAIILAAGNSVVVQSSEQSAVQNAKAAIYTIGRYLPESTIQIACEDLSGEKLDHSALSMVVMSAQNPTKFAARQRLANRSGAITPLVEFDESVCNPFRTGNYLSFFSEERTKTDNLVARGGNTQLFNLKE